MTMNASSESVSHSCTVTMVGWLSIAAVRASARPVRSRAGVRRRSSGQWQALDRHATRHLGVEGENDRAVPAAPRSVSGRIPIEDERRLYHVYRPTISTRLSSNVRSLPESGWLKSRTTWSSRTSEIGRRHLLTVGTLHPDDHAHLGLHVREDVDRNVLERLRMALAVGLIRRDGDRCRFAHGQSCHRGLEAGDHRLLAERERERVAPFAAVELRSVGQRAPVVHANGLAGLWIHGAALLSERCGFSPHSTVRGTAAGRRGTSGTQRSTSSIASATYAAASALSASRTSSGSSGPSAGSAT